MILMGENTITMLIFIVVIQVDFAWAANPPSKTKTIIRIRPCPGLIVIIRSLKRHINIEASLHLSLYSPH